MADANPLNNSLPAEVVLRRRPQVVRKVDTDEVEVDLKVALVCKPEARVRWLTKACAMAKSGRASSRELFDIIANRRFTAGLPFKVGRRIASIAHENRILFSERQQRYMQSSEWILTSKYGVDTAERQDDEESEDDEDEVDVGASVQNQETNSVNSKIKEDSDPLEARLDPKRLWEAALQNRRNRSAQEGRSRRGDQESARRADSERGFSERERGRQSGSQDGTRTADDFAEDLTEEQQQARREALEKRLAAEERERQQRREARKRQKEDAAGVFSAALGESQQTNKEQLEQEVDSSLQMLERLTQRQQPPEEEAPRRRRRRRNNSRSRSIPVRLPDYGAGRRRRRRGLSRSRSISIQAASVSPSPTGRRFKAAPGETFEEALARRMSQRDSELDSARIPVTWKREEMRRGMHVPIRGKRVTPGQRFIS